MNMLLCSWLFSCSMSSMKWILFTGTWRLTSPEVEEDVRAAAREVLSRGDGIVTGGATGVDYFAMTEALKIDPTGNTLKVFLPTHLENYIRDYRENWCWAPVTKESIDALAACLSQLAQVKLEHLHALPEEGAITQEHYNLRHNDEVAHSDEVYAFHVNASTGTQDTIDKATAAGLPLSLHKKYTITE